MKMPVTDCEVLSLDTGVIDCPTTGEKVPVLFMTVRITGQGIVNLAIRNPRRLKHDVPLVIRRSTVLNGGKFVPEHPEGESE
ncbi:hypothetical protein DTL42_14220 [Bremerella cremea]|uniref:Uncharacterized protein n=1 Tax=Bremerella cremea TaxID=1031537 RepID=A0A368KPX2_9BACT|nr:hypothetical protein [Bremerella cremea]RCS47671.1 hypothetical protein DTL42_14220 [Bremerella cremea]